MQVSNSALRATKNSRKPHLRDVRHLAKVELVVELDRRRQEVVHDGLVEVDRRVGQLASHHGDVGLEDSEVATDHLVVD